MYIQNCTVVTQDDTLSHHTIVIEKTYIRDIGPSASVKHPPDVEPIDGAGLLAVPGFIDLQFNGAFGHDFTANPETIWRVAADLPRYGVTAFLPTIITSPLETVAAAQRVLRKGPPSGWQGATPLGLHIEGPFLNPAKKGAHNPIHLRPPSLEAVADWSPEQGIRLVTLAPELPGALTVIEALQARGVVVSAGHSMATYDEAQAGFAAGVSYGTHLFNAMPTLGHRQPGLVGALLNNPAATIGLIPDGIHVHPAIIKLIWAVKGGERLTLVSDAMTALGQPPGRYQIGDQAVIVSETEARLGDGTLAGSILPLDAGLRNLIAFSGASLAEALPTVTTTPAAVLGVAQQRGRLRSGQVADIVLLTPELEAAMTIIQGQVLYTAPPWTKNKGA